MNQILITGEERKKREKKVLDIKTIVLFYAICMIVLGILFISGSVYAKAKINEMIELNAKPTVNISRNDEDDTIEIIIKHIRGIKAIQYNWNEEEVQTIDGQNQKEIKQVLELIGGTNTLTVVITEENGQSVTYQKTFTAGNIPKIELEAVSNGIKILASGESKIDYINYSWDNGEKQTIEVGENEYEEIIPAPNGKHTLKIEVVDVKKNIATKTQLVVGDAAPTLTVKGQKIDDEVVFVIDAEDDEEITKIEIEMNFKEEDKQVINVNAKTYHNEIIMEEQGWNYLVVTVYNNNNLSTTSRVKFEKK